MKISTIVFRGIGTSKEEALRQSHIYVLLLIYAMFFLDFIHDFIIVFKIHFGFNKYQYIKVTK